MGWQDRQYASDEHHPYARRRPAYRGSGMGALSVTTTIIIANVIVAFLMFSRGPLGQRLTGFGVMQADAVLHGQVWRLFTATYMHASFNHILFNMLALYFLGPALERAWGRRQFFFVYTLGGVVGNMLLTLAGLIGWINPQTFGVGASGSVLTLLGAAAVLFPDAQVYVYFLFPVRIRTCAVLYGIWYVYNIWTRGGNYGGDICHAGGLIIGLWWAYSGGFSLSGRHRTAVDPSSIAGKLRSLFGGASSRRRHGAGAWHKRMKQRQEDSETIERILAKVSEQGLRSLTREEKRALKEATERRRAEEARFDRVDRE
ncbi:MAG: rhomboid family intramembrane serine protease [Phycisphaerae bacterium]